MSKLPILNKNAFLSIVIKDNAIWSHLAYTDYNTDTQYVLVDYTDISHLKRRLDDHVFLQGFWNQYFNILQKSFNWEIFKQYNGELYRVVEFNDEGVGVNGVRVEIDDNQEFFTRIYQSLNAYSYDIAIRVIDNKYIRNLIGLLSNKLGYKDIIYLDLDIKTFQCHRVINNLNQKTSDNRLPKLYTYHDSVINWGNKTGLIDSIKNSKLRAFLASDIDNGQLQNKWANLILHPVDVVGDYEINDILRSYTTVQLLSLLNDNRKKFEGFGNKQGESLLILGGKITRLLGKKTSLLSIIDGLELYGTFDVAWDKDCKLLSYGISSTKGKDSMDILIGINDVISALTKVVIPELKSKKFSDKVIFSSSIRSQDYDTKSEIILGNTFELLNIENRVNKVVFEGRFENNVYIPSLEDMKLEFLSSPKGLRYDQLLIDSRLRPIVYGMDAYSNKVKLNRWLNDSQK